MARNFSLEPADRRKRWTAYVKRHQRLDSETLAADLNLSVMSVAAIKANLTRQADNKMTAALKKAKK